MPIAKETGGDFTPVEAGTWLGRCFACIALGVQESPNFPATSKVMLMFEIPEQTVEIQGNEVPMTIKKEYSLSLNEKATLRKHLESWRGRQFTKDELAGFDVANVVGSAALITVVHKVSGKGKTYANIEALAKPMKKMTCPPQHHVSVIYDIEQGKNEVYQKLPEWLQKEIAKCEEWTHPKIANEGGLDQLSDSEPPVDDDVPF